MTTFYRVRGTLLASYAPHDGEPDVITLDLIVPGSSAHWAEGAARMIAARDYDRMRWATRPTIEQLQEETNHE